MANYRRLWVEGEDANGVELAVWINLEMMKSIQYVNVANNAQAKADIYFIDSTKLRLDLRTSQSMLAAQESLGLRVATFPVTTTSGGAYSYSGKAAVYGDTDFSYRRILANQIDIETGASLGFVWLNLDQVKYVMFGNLPGITQHMVVYFVGGASIAVERGFLSLGQPDTKLNHQLWHDNYFIKNYDQITYVSGLPVTNVGYLIDYND